MKSIIYGFFLMQMGLLFSSCIFEKDEDTDKDGNFKPIEVGAESCGEVTGADKKSSDSLMALANQQMVEDMRFYFNGDVESWEEFKGHDPKPTYSLYNQTLKKAPNHCGAMFGRTISSLMLISQDPDLDEFIQKLETENEQPTAKLSSGKALLKMTPEEAPSAMFALSQQLNKQDPATISEAQSLIENVFMPKVDTAIAYLSTIIEEDDFAFRFEVDEEVYELDISEVGPLLASFKIAKAWMLIVVGYNWDLSLDGKYDWVETLGNMDDEDFKNLTLEQTDALDHLTSLFSVESNFSRMKDKYKSEIKAIPSLILSATEDLKRGLTYSISESNSPQTYDLFRVGTNMDYDVTPSDLEKMVNLLDIAGKYLKGEVLIDYNKGTQNIKVNFPKLFEVDGIQKLLPYFKFRPYEDWATYLNADTIWTSYLYMEAASEIFSELNMERDYRTDFSVDNGTISMTVFENGSVDTVYARVTLKGCEAHYVKERERIGDENDIIFVGEKIDTETGSFTLENCEESADGTIYGDASGIYDLGMLAYLLDYEVRTQLGYSDMDYSLEPTTMVNEDGDTVIVYQTSEYYSEDKTIATLTHIPGTNCEFTYEQFVSQSSYEDQWGGTSYSYEDFSNSGEVTLSQCRETSGGLEFVDYVDGDFLGPLYFTDKDGKKTLEVYELEQYEDNIPALKNKIVFRDPTMGGIFPGLTNDNIWSTIKSLETVEPRSKEVCEEVWDENGFYEYKCELIKAKNPSDLDLIIENIYWLDNM